MFEGIDAMPRDLRQHIRYPEDLFTIQANMYATYHMRDPQVFYNKEDLWHIPSLSTDRPRYATGTVLHHHETEFRDGIRKSSF